MEPHDSTDITIVLPALVEPDDLVATISSLAEDASDLPCDLIVAQRATDFDVPGAVGGTVSSGTCLALPDDDTSWATCIVEGAAYAETELVGIVVPGHRLAPGWFDRMNDMLANGSAVDHKLGELELRGSALEVLVARRDELIEHGVPELDSNGPVPRQLDPWSIVHAFSRSLTTASPPVPVPVPLDEAPGHDADADADDDAPDDVADDALDDAPEIAPERDAATDPETASAPPPPSAAVDVPTASSKPASAPPPPAPGSQAALKQQAKQQQETAPKKPAHAQSFDDNLDGIGARMAEVFVERRDAKSGGRVRWERLGLQRGLTSIVILTFDQWQYTEQCLDSIAAHTPQDHEVIVVDNGSTDGTVEHLRERDDVIVIENAENRGFGGGCNQGMAVASGDRIVLLNNDTVVVDGWLQPMLDALIHDPRRGIVGPRSNYVSGPQLVQDVSYDTETLEGLDDFALEFQEEHRGSGATCDRVIGFCMVLHRHVIDRIGGFDLRFGLGNLEDDDLCLRARVAGFQPFMCNDAYVHHFGSKTFEGAGIDYSGTLDRNWNEFLRKWRFPQGSVDWQRRGYHSEAIVASTSFSPADHYAPMTGVVQQDARITFDARTRSIFVPAEWASDDELVAALTDLFTTYNAADDVTIVVRASGNDDPAMAQLNMAADAVGDAGIPDVVVVPAGPEAVMAVARSCTEMYCHGRATGMLHRLATAVGSHPILPTEGHEAEGASWDAA